MTYTIVIVLGTLYGFLFGLIPVAGATTGLITIFGFLSLFKYDPYLLVVFTTALVVASSIGDSFASVVMNIPGAGGSAATMVDGFPLAQNGQAARALSAAVVTSTVNGLIWGILVFAFLPYYSHIVLMFGIPEMLAFLVLAFTSVVFITNRYWIRGILSLALGVFTGLIGQNPITGAERFTFDWQYLGAGIQFAPLMAGVLAFPELYGAYMNRKESLSNINDSLSNWHQVWQGFVDSWKHKWDGLRGGFIGAIVGLIPGLGGNIADWLAYGQTVAFNQKEKIPFGYGNIKGVIGCEGANNAQKATSYVPTILFGIPGAPFEVIIISLFMLVGLELGSPELLTDMTFFKHITESYMIALLLSFVIGIVFIKYAANITKLPFSWYFYPIMALLIWASVQYTGGVEDYIMFALLCGLGILLKYIKFSRAAFIIGFVLADRLEGIIRQFDALYSLSALFTRPVSLTLTALCFFVVIYGIFYNKGRIEYT